MADFILDLGIVLFFSTIGSMIALKLRQPAVIGLLFMGAAIGPRTLGLVAEDSSIWLFSEIGAALLLFSIGLEFSIKKLARLGGRAIIATSITMGIAFLAVYGLAILAGFGAVTAVYAAAILSISSTAVSMKILQQAGFIKRQEVPMLTAILVIEDVVAVFALTFFSAFVKGPAFSLSGTVLPIFIALAVLSVTYTFLLKTLKLLLEWMHNHRADEAILTALITTCVILSYLAAQIGLSASIGAFLAGSIIASMPQSGRLTKMVRPFESLFSAIFFLSIGMRIDLGSLAGSFGVVTFFVLATAASKFIGVGAGMYLSGFSGRSAIFSGILLLPVGEFSLLIARTVPGTALLGFDLLGVTAVTVLLSSLLASISLTAVEPAYQAALRLLPDGLLNTLKKSRDAMDRLLRPLEASSYLLKKLQMETGRIFQYLGLIAVIGTVSIYSRDYLRQVALIDGRTLPAFSNILFFALTFYFSFHLFKRINGAMNLIETGLFMKRKSRRVFNMAKKAFLASLLLFGFPLILSATGTPITANVVLPALLALGILIGLAKKADG